MAASSVACAATSGTASSDAEGGARWSAFLSYGQASGGGIVLAVREAVLHACGVSRTPCPTWWYDQDEWASDEGMEAGVTGSAVFVLFATHDVLERPAVQLEVRAALGMGKRIVVVAPSPLPCSAVEALALPVARGRAFSTNPAKLADGLVQLHEADFAALLLRVQGQDAVPYTPSFPALMRDTVPCLLRALEWEPSLGAVLVDPAFRMRRPLTALHTADVLLLGGHAAAHQVAYLHSALGPHACAGRHLELAALHPDATVEVATSAVRSSRAVVVVLTGDVWESSAVRSALTEVAVRGGVLALVHETDTRFGGVNLEGVLSSCPDGLQGVMRGHVAHPLKRKKAHRAELVAWLLARVGALRGDVVLGGDGQACPPPQAEPMPVQQNATA